MTHIMNVDSAWKLGLVSEAFARSSQPTGIQHEVIQKLRLKKLGSLSKHQDQAREFPLKSMNDAGFWAPFPEISWTSQVMSNMSWTHINTSKIYCQMQDQVASEPSSEICGSINGPAPNSAGSKSRFSSAFCSIPSLMYKAPEEQLTLGDFGDSEETCWENCQHNESCELARFYSRLCRKYGSVHHTWNVAKC